MSKEVIVKIVQVTVRKVHRMAYLVLYIINLYFLVGYLKFYFLITKGKFRP